MKHLLKYLRHYKKETVLAPLFKMLEASFELFVPLVMAQIVDVGIRQHNIGYVLHMGGILVLLGMIGLICSITAQYFAAKSAVGFGTELRHDLFVHIQGLSYTEMDRTGTSTLITRMTSDVNQVQNGINLVLRLLLRSPFIVFGAMIMAFTIEVKATIVFIVTIPLLSLVVFGVMGISMPLYRSVQNRLDRVLQLTRENLTGIRVIRAFNKEEEEKKNFEEANQALVKQQLFVGKISALMNPLTYVIVNAAIIVLLWTGALQVNDGVITQGELIALVNYMSQILVELVKLANLIITITKALACANRLQTVFETKSSMAEGEKTWDMVDSSVEFSHVSFAYAGAREDSLTDIHFRAESGETIGIIGGTGSGKSSLVNLIPRFYDAREGSITVGGRDVTEYSYEQLRDQIGIVPQKAVLFTGTIADNLRWGKKDATEEEMKKALEAAQAMDIIESKEKGLEEHILQGGKNLSGGQRQRLTIARALIKQPKILILDDSASALDYATDAKLRKAIRELDSNMTVFIVSQRAVSIWHADKIIVLEDGEMVGMGTHEQLLNSCETYQEIYYSQFPKDKQKGGIE